MSNRKKTRPVSRRKRSGVGPVGIFYRPDNRTAAKWEKKIQSWLRARRPAIAVDDKKPKKLIVLGGDGTILAAARAYQRISPLIIGLNLGRVGFLASCREPKQFFPTLKGIFGGKYWVVRRMMISATVYRKQKPIFTTHSLNDVSIQDLLGLVELAISIEGHPFQYIRGTGVLVATATGSTAQNLSARGPIVMPDIKCLIITEISDHNIPTPSIVVKRNKEVEIKILGFRKRGMLSLTRTGKPIDVALVSDETVFPLEKGDVIRVRRSPRLAKFAELDKSYFLKSLQEKFAFR